jgi:hypothetical protein
LPPSQNRCSVSGGQDRVWRIMGETAVGRTCLLGLPIDGLFVSLVYCAESTVRWFVVREKHCWMTADSADKSKRTGREAQRQGRRGTLQVAVRSDQTGPAAARPVGWVGSVSATTSEARKQARAELVDTTVKRKCLSWLPSAPDVVCFAEHGSLDTSASASAASSGPFPDLWTQSIHRFQPSCNGLPSTCSAHES